MSSAPDDILEQRKQRVRAAPFISGSIIRHLLLMTAMGAIGLMALFLVDFADLWFVARLADIHATAGLGLAGAVGFLHLSLGLGLGISAGALVAIRLGRGQPERARSIAATSLLLAMGLGAGFALIVLWRAEPILSLLGARGETLRQGALYLRIIALGFPLLAGALIFSFTLRGLGLPVRAMLITLTTAITNALLDPVFIFVFGWGLAGAAVATVCGNIASFGVGAFNLHRHYRHILGPASRPGDIFRPGDARADVREIARMALPVMLTQLATPVLSAYMMWAATRFGEQAVAAMTVINRLAPVAFGIVFALSGAVGPIIGQNHGARLFARVRHAYEAGLLFAFGYTLASWAVLFLLADAIPGWFSLSGEAAHLVRLFCRWLAAAWLFTGGQFVAQAAFNNLEHPRLSTLFNWARAIIGTMLPVELLSPWLGAVGVLLGAALGWALVGLAAMLTAWRIIRRKEQAAGGGMKPAATTAQG